MRVDVTAYRAANRAFPSPTEDHTVAIVTATNRSETLLQDEVAQKLSWLLRERGYEVAPKENAVYLLRCWFSMDPGQIVEEYDPPIRNEVGYHYCSRGYSGYHWATGINLGRAYAIYCKYLTLTLYDRAAYESNELPEITDAQRKQTMDDAAIWQCTAGACNNGSDLRWHINHLLLATMETWGEDTPKQRTITIKEDTDAFEQLSTVKP